MARLAAGQGFALDLALESGEARLADGFVADAFTILPDASSIAAGAGSQTITRKVAGRTHATTLDYAAAGSGTAAAVRFTGLTDRDPGGALRYRIEGLDVALTGGTLDRLGARVFQQIDGFVGADGNDSVHLGIPGGRSFDGGGGTDRAVYGADPRRYALQDGAYRAEAPVVVALDGSGRRYGVVSSRGADTLTDVELLTIDGRTAAPAAFAFDARSYLAANRDLAVAFGDDVVAAAAHYAWNGRNERRSLGGFDALGYLGANPDVLAAVGVNADAALRHYLAYGAREGRTAGFDPYGYLASNLDVLAAYGADPVAALTHYARFGLREGRTATGFDALGYIASYPDLIAAFGTDGRAATRHYLSDGRREGRGVTFDAAAYLAANPDVASATGGNAAAAEAHYIGFGLREGRMLRPGPSPIAHPTVSLGERLAVPVWAADLLLQGAPQGVPQGMPVAVTGTVGNDTLSGSAAYDALGNPITDAVDGLAGIDSFVLTGAIASYSLSIDSSGALMVGGPDGTDTLIGIELLQATDGIYPVGSLVGFSQPSLTGLTVSVSASAGNDYLVGGIQGDAIGGGAGNDTIAGLGGSDTLFGNAGNDVLLGGDGVDQLEGGAGNDLMFGGPGNDLMRGDLIDVVGNDTLLGEDGNDWLDAGAGNDWLDGGGGNDTLYGGLGGDVLRGGDGDDVLFGDVYSDRSHEISVNPNDTVTGYEDVLLGGAGSDTLVGGHGADLMDGGAGADVFSIRNLNESTLAAPDVILNFNGAVVAAEALKGLASYATAGAEGDRIDLSEIDAIAGIAGNDAFTFIGTAGFTAAGQLRYQASGSATLIEGDVNGDRTADFRIQVDIANYSFSAFDFVL
ncbi:calcium-binding protein [Azospirillum sp. YIM B02556]|uniref:Calcium-binding protein n=1 Tax=Azospirillum endophyticum TaxID=2800326 RepID=A0ABS1FBM0_9PROT|nr:calcium-binding protein [Azospirillum endophyticum]MBK1840826.1 calcium-binding protein [Azospirillum endophyticum]